MCLQALFNSEQACFVRVWPDCCFIALCTLYASCDRPECVGGNCNGYEVSCKYLRWLGLAMTCKHGIIIIIIMLPNQAIASTPSAPRPSEANMASVFSI
jgi:hypothetical protein